MLNWEKYDQISGIIVLNMQLYDTTNIDKRAHNYHIHFFDTWSIKQQ